MSLSLVPRGAGGCSRAGVHTSFGVEWDESAFSYEVKSDRVTIRQ